MQYIHVKSLEKYHPGYKDRTLLWAKIHIKMIQGDPECEMITNETDWARLVKFILLELNAQKPLPLDPVYLRRKGFDLKRRPIELTLKMLHTFIDIVSVTDSERIQDVTYNRVEIDIDKSRVDNIMSGKPDQNNIYHSIIDHLNTVSKKNFRATSENTRKLIRARLKDGFKEEDFKAVIDKKAKQWMGDVKMDNFLRPETLFGPKFENYINEKVTDQNEFAKKGWLKDGQPKTK